MKHSTAGCLNMQTNQGLLGKWEWYKITARKKLKLEDRIMTCIFLGYAQNHMGGTYCTLNIRMKCVVLSCDVLGGNKTYDK